MAFGMEAYLKEAGNMTMNNQYRAIFICMKTILIVICCKSYLGRENLN